MAFKLMLITGSSCGIGASTAVLAAQNGYCVSVTGRDAQKLEEVGQKCVESGLKDEQVLMTIGCLTDPEFRKELVSKTMDKFGRLDVLVNNAGMSKQSTCKDLYLSEFDKLMDINLRAVVDLSKLCMPFLIESKGNIINVSSICALKPLTEGVIFYSMTKAALDMFTKCLALELAPKGVRVNSVNPGFTKTNILDPRIPGFKYGIDQNAFYDLFATQHPTGRVAEPEEIAQCILFLVSDKADFIIGQQQYIDGGLTLVGPWARKENAEKMTVATNKL